MHFWLILFSTLLMAYSPAEGWSRLAEARESLFRTTISGVILDAETGESVPFAYVTLQGINRTTTSDRDGRFELRNIPSGVYTLNIQRIGYRPTSRRITLRENEILELEIEMLPETISGQAVEVVADAERTTGSRVEHASLRITGESLRRDLGNTLSGTLSNQAGFSERSMGATAGRPVIRGLGDQRVVILEDGGPTGDVSWSSGDHAVTVDPSSAHEIEIVRGPAALEHGSGAIGGVINVVRNQIPNTIPTRAGGTLSLIGSSVNRGGGGSGSIEMPLGSLVVSADVSGRTGGDYRIPGSTLPNTGLRSTSNSLGASYIRPWGYTGISASMYLNNYGIPPNPDGGHTSGVDIEMSKYQVESRTEILIRNSFLDLLEIRGSAIGYHHAEIEPGGAIGSEYAMNTITGSVKLKNGRWGIFDQGGFGVWGEYVDYSVVGVRTPDSHSFSGALYLIQEANIGAFHLEAGVRLNHFAARPKEEKESLSIGHIRNRGFTGLESSLAGIYDFGRGFYLGATVMHSWRAPTLEELFSEGPHLAVYTYELGNPDLPAERGLGNELFLRYRNGGTYLQISTFYNHFTNFLHAQKLGKDLPPRPDLTTYQNVGTRAGIYGLEFSGEQQLNRNLKIHGNLSWTIGDRWVTDRIPLPGSGGAEGDTLLVRSKQPLPMMPPLNGMVGMTWSHGGFSADMRLRLSDRQNRIDEELETPTAGYTVLDLSLQYRFTLGGSLQTLALNAQNLLDETYHNHLSLVKDHFPEPGRSINLLYRAYF